MKLAPQQAQLFGERATQVLGALDAGVAGGAEGEEPGELRNPGLAMMDDERLTGATTAAFTVVAGQDLFAQPGKVPPVPALTLVATPTLPCHIYKD